MTGVQTCALPIYAVGVVLRFGKYATTQQPGLHFKLPFGVDEVISVPIKRQLKLEFGFGTPGATNIDQPSDDPQREKSMVTGDLNAALVEWVVQYHVGDPILYSFHVREPGQTLRDLSEATMREVVGDHTVDEVITVGRQEIEIKGLERMRELVKEYKLGLTIDQVQLKNVNPPQQVQWWWWRSMHYCMVHGAAAAQTAAAPQPSGCSLFQSRWT